MTVGIVTVVVRMAVIVAVRVAMGMIVIVSMPVIVVMPVFENRFHARRDGYFR